LENIIRLKEGETNIIGGFIKDDVRGGISGIPGFSKLPIIGKFFGTSGKTSNKTDLVFSITPHIIRQVELEEYDKKTIWSDTEQTPSGGNGGGIQEATRSPRGGREDRPSRRSNDSIVISPAKRRSPINSAAFFTLRLNSREKLQALSIGGSISGGNAEIEEIKTNFFGKADVGILSNANGSSFDLGYTFPQEDIRVNVVAQLKVKFLEKGNYTINLGTLNATNKEQQSVSLTGTTAEIEVY